MDHLRVFCSHLFGGASPRSAGAVASCPQASGFPMVAPGSSTVTIGPGLYPTVGYRVRDLLLAGFQFDRKLNVATYADCMSITSSCNKATEAVICAILASFKHQRVKVDLKSNSESALSVTMRTEGLAAARVNTVCMMNLHDLSTGKAELEYLHDYAGICTGVTLKRYPIINVSALFGSKKFAVGGDVNYDTATGRFSKFDVALGLATDGRFSSLMLTDKGDSLTAGYYYLINKEEKLAFGAEMNINFSSKECSTTVGMQQFIDSETLVKLRYNSKGAASILIQHEVMPKSFVTVSGEINCNDIKESPKIGLNVVLKP